jgi:hypothetical protein
LEAFRIWEQMEEPEWANVNYEITTGLVHFNVGSEA